MPLWLWLSLLAIAALLALSALFSGSEAAFLSVSRVRVRALANAGEARARVLQGLVQRPERVLTAILIGNNIVNIAASALVARAAFGLFGDLGVALGTGVLTFLVLMLGEVTPKSFATRHAEYVALRMARPLAFFVAVLSPVAAALTGLANVVIRLFGGHTRLRAPFITEEEIKLLVTIGEQEGTIERSERDMVHSVFRFSDMQAQDVMTPLARVYRLPVTATLDEALKSINDSGHSRLPVYDTKPEAFIGMVYAKDLLRYKDPELASLTVKHALRPIGFVRGTRRVHGVLKEMQRQGHHIAVVITDAGEPLGLLSLEDILEELVGEIYDEYDLLPGAAPAPVPPPPAPPPAAAPREARGPAG